MSMVIRERVDMSRVMETLDIPHIPVLLLMFLNILLLHMPSKMFMTTQCNGIFTTKNVLTSSLERNEPTFHLVTADSSKARIAG